MVLELKTKSVVTLNNSNNKDMAKQKKIQIGTSLNGNLQENTWTFEMADDMWIKAGKFAIIDVTKLSINQSEALSEFVNNL